MEDSTMVSIAEFINQTGFPVAASIGMYWLANKTLKSVVDILQDLKTAITNNTTAIEEISESMKKG